MKVVIVGAGLGGLCAALGFARKGHHVQVLEQRPDPTPAGGAINIRPGATKILHGWGLAPDLRRLCSDTPANVLRKLATGEVATRAVAADISDYPDWGTNRDVVIDLFYRKAVAAGATVTFNAAVARVEDDSGAAYITLQDGSRLEADVVLAADGIRSVIREQILRKTGRPIDPILTGNTLYGIRLTREQMDSDPGLRPLMDQSYLNVYMGEDSVLSVTSRYNTTLGTYAGLFGINGETDQQGLWDTRGDIDYVRMMFKGACPELRKVLEIADSCDRWRLAELPDLPRWTSEEGRIVLLGDSAATQGFSLIVEDIGVLEYLISKTANPRANMKAVTATWEHIRKPRCERIKAWARYNTQLFQSPLKNLKPGTGQWQVKSLKHTKPDMKAEFGTAPFLKWAQGTDAIEEVSFPVLRDC
ncbi:FAD-dependent monooxygenase OpS4 [Colletotrichum sidae]|uniref:FAD-dependent monooxygenase OpS4 n=1 Tax=Colletotrichum sidae TaxID=1347389 RepID=A0A4R8TD19_9PEZI|nr:FAD-dependent monooxygenase OpS4 [Colletotrichum sidae]